MIAGAWAALTSWFDGRVRIAAYHYLCLVGGISVALIAARYQLSNYFGDFMNFTVVKNLGGGNIKEAITYGFEEGRIFAVLSGVAIVAYVVVGFLLARRQKRSPTAITFSLRPRNYAVVACVSALGLAVLILVANRNEDFRYHLNRVTAYSYSRDVLDNLTDFDRDGFGYFAWTPDPAPFDATYPNASSLTSRVTGSTKMA